MCPCKVTFEVHVLKPCFIQMDRLGSLLLFGSVVWHVGS